MVGNDLCVACISLVGGDRAVAPHPDLREVKGSPKEKLFRCVTCDAWWNVRELGWGRLIR